VPNDLRLLYVRLSMSKSETHNPHNRSFKKGRGASAFKEAVLRRKINALVYICKANEHIRVGPYGVEIVTVK
jgi:hypothetical protein